MTSSEFRIDVYRNAVPSTSSIAHHCAVRVTHIPTGFTETRSVPQDAGSQLRCRDLALEAVEARLLVQEENEESTS